MDPSAVHAEAHGGLEFIAPLLRQERRSASVVEDIVTAAEARRKNGDWSADLVARKREEQVRAAEAECAQRLQLHDRSVLDVSRSARQRLRRARPIFVLAPLSGVGDP